MIALHTNETWELFPLLVGKLLVACLWIYIVKIGLDGKVNQLKAHLGVKGYIQTCGHDYNDTFFPVIKMPFVRLFISIMCNWPLYQLNIKNAFFHGEL